jgi:hypothetical protein
MKMYFTKAVLVCVRQVLPTFKQLPVRLAWLSYKASKAHTLAGKVKSDDDNAVSARTEK